MLFTKIRQVLKFIVRTCAGLFIVLLVAIFGFRANAYFQEAHDATALSPTNGKFVETSQGVMHVSVWGENNSRTLLMTHGMAAWGGLWHDTAKIMAQNGYRVIAVDQPPFGFSDRDDPDFSRSKQAQRLKALETALALDEYTLLGHSYGGGVALEMALRHPENIRKLVLVCPVVGVSEDTQTTPTQLPWILENQIIAEHLVSLTVTNPLMTGFLTKRFMHRSDSLTDAHVEILKRPMTLKNNTSFMVKWLQQFINQDPQALSRRQAEVEKLSVPVNFIWGDKDTVTPISQGQDLADILNPEKFHRLENIGHMPQLEASSLFNRALLDVLSTR